MRVSDLPTLYAMLAATIDRGGALTLICTPTGRLVLISLRGSDVDRGELVTAYELQQELGRGLLVLV